MINISVFIDSSVIIAFHNADDENHNRAKILMKDIVDGEYGKAFVSDYVFAECVTVALLKLKNLKEAVNLGNYLIGSEISILKASESIIQNAWNIFQKRNTGKLSFADCVSISFLDMLGLDYLATFDREFQKIAGLKIIGL